MKVFIGSSTKIIEFDLMKNVIEKLKNISRYDIKPWWKENVIPQGEYFFPRIIELSKECDFGIFFLNNENTGENNSENILNVNVLIEIGLFISQIGIDNVAIIIEKGTPNISDFQGINLNKTYDFKNDIEDISNYIEERVFYSSKISHKDYLYSNIMFNTRTTNKIFSCANLTKDWQSKSLYIGLKAAKEWAKVERNPNYISSDFSDNFSNFIRNNSEKLKDIDNIVSLGCGLGSLDEKIVRNIVGSKRIRYIPIDINPYLAQQALNKITNAVLKNHNSFAIVDDFEEDVAQLRDLLRSKIPKSEKTLFVMLGGTFSNIEDIYSFLNEFSILVDSNDYFLLDYFTKQNDYDSKMDMENRIKSSYSKEMMYMATKYRLQEKFDTINVQDIFDTTQDIYVDVKECKEFRIGTRFEFFLIVKTNCENKSIEKIFQVSRFDKKKIKKDVKKYFTYVERQNISIGDKVDRTFVLLKSLTNGDSA